MTYAPTDNDTPPVQIIKSTLPICSDNDSAFQALRNIPKRQVTRSRHGRCYLEAPRRWCHGDVLSTVLTILSEHKTTVTTRLIEAATQNVSPFCAHRFLFCLIIDTSTCAADPHLTMANSNKSFLLYFPPTSARKIEQVNTNRSC